jgi:hypothetical protein
MSALNNPRLFESDLTPNMASVVFNANPYQMNMQMTAYGDFTFQAVDLVTLATEDLITKKMDHFMKVVKRCRELEHNNKNLRDHIQVFLHFDPISAPYPPLIQ